ncbi:MAG: isoleucine--tRNA ligase [Acidobacteriota bacterium]
MPTNWKDTLNLPKTAFSMKANLTQKEPDFLQRWDEEDLYGKILEARRGAPVFSFHDGPPYANGRLHLGHALNKILKDLVTRSRLMEGFKVYYRPGWDCHGLPIEQAVEKERGRKVRSMPVHDFRAACRNYAEKYIDIQRTEFRRLGVLGDWDHPYRTMDYSYEAKIAESFGECFLKGYVYKGLKPVQWCSSCETALAEAEVEYEDHESPSIYVKFALNPGQDEHLPDSLKGPGRFVVIWTTTPWTLPANLAVAFHPDFVYAAVKSGSEVYVVAEELLESFYKETGLTGEVLETFKGSVLEGVTLRHPFLERDSLGILAPHVTKEQGTGCVHTAPGHGQEDYVIGRKYKLEIYNPVDDRGRFVEDVDHFAGMQVFEANPHVLDLLREKNALLAFSTILHSYPHCWRCKNPLIFRATRQWFISMDHEDLRGRTLSAIDRVEWVPPWGRNRIYSMVENRPDWCISRQRRWGVPIIVLFCEACGEPVREPSFFQAVAAEFRERGAGVWSDGDPARWLPDGFKCPKCGGAGFERESDILDVWFDSGVSHEAIMGQTPDLPWPSELYLEGSDQHRGWFHTSILTGMMLRNESPYRRVITHGFILDGDGRKMSKSLGNVISPDEVVKKYGAEILRLWVSMVDYRDDVRVSWDLLKRNADAYLKIRNTLRYLLGNLFDFDPQKDMAPGEDLLEMDRYILIQLNNLVQRIRGAYRDFSFHLVYHELVFFCSVTLSAFYLDILKDRLYCSAADGKARRSAQTVLYRAADAMIRLMAPILPVTAEEAWGHLPGREESSVHLARFPEPENLAQDSLTETWDRLKALRDDVNKALEDARREGLIGKSLEAKLVLACDDGDLGELIRRYEPLLPEIFIVSAVELEDAEPQGPAIRVEAAPGVKCARCWTVTDDPRDVEGGPLCPRCAGVAGGRA